MNKQRKTSHILNIFQYDADGHVVIPASLTLGIAPAGDDNSAKVPSTAWVRTYVASIGGVLGTGTTNYVSKFTASGSIGNSLIFDNGTTVLIGTTTAPTPVMGVSFPFSVTSSAATRIRIDSTQATPNAGVGLYANGVQKFSFAMFGATSDFTIYNDALLAASLLVKGNTNNILIGTSSDNSSKLRVNGTGWFDNTLTATSFVKNGGASTEILAADGSVITAGTGITISGGTISSTVTGGVTSFNTRTGAITLSSNDVTTALGFTPISSYTETDTLATVTARGASTTTQVSINSGTLQHLIIANRFHLIGGSNFHITNNAYYDGVFKYKDSISPASKLMISGGGALVFDYAATGTIDTGITFTTLFTVGTNGSVTANSFIRSGGTSTQFLMADGSVSTNPGWITGYTETDTLASVTGRGASTSTNVTFSGTGNQFSGHHYFLPWDSNGNHYPHYNVGASNNGSKLNLRMFGGNGSVTRVFFLNGNDGTISWDGNTIWHSGNLTNLNQLTNGPGYLTGESDTLATVTGRGATTSSPLYFSGGSSTTPALHIRSGGNNWSEGLAIHPSTDNSYALAFFRTKSSYTDNTDTWALGNMGETGIINHFALLRRGLTGSSVNGSGNAVFSVNPNGTFRFGFNPLVGSNTILHAGNFNSYAPTLTGGGASGTWGIRITGFANQGTARLYSTDSSYNYDAANPYFGFLTYDGTRWLFQVSPGTPAAVRVAYADSAGSASSASNSTQWDGYSLPTWTNWSSRGSIAIVVGQLGWKNYGNNHVIFDASNGTSPTGSGVNNTNPDVAWTGTYPTLMGWNGSNTYGVRVDSARRADNVEGFGAGSFYRNLGFGSGYPSWDLNTVDPDRSGFTYSNGAPYTGPFIHIGASGYGMQFNANYGNGELLAYRVRNGDNGTWSAWRRLIFEGGGFNFSSLTVNSNTVLHAGNYTSYAIPIGGGWYGVNLPGSRWYGYSVNGGEIVFGRDLPNNGQMGMLIDGAYLAGENNGFWSLPSDNNWNGRRGMFWNGSQLDFTTNSPNSIFADISIVGSAHKYLQINPGNGYEAMVRYIGGSGSSWYVGKRTSSQLVGTTDFHFYSEAVNQTVAGIDTGANMYSSGSMRSPIFYDQNNTGYYSDPDARTSLNTLTVNGGTNYFYGITYFETNNSGYSGSTDSAKLQAYSSSNNSAFMSFHKGGHYAVNFGLDADNVMRIGGWSAAANRWQLDMSGNNWVAGSFRAPIFYDSDNTAYYLNPNGGSYFASSIEVANGYFLVSGAGGASWLSSAQGSFGGYLRFSQHAVIETYVGGYHVYVVSANGNGVVKFDGAQSWSAHSDSRIKTVHSTLENNLSKLDGITPIYYSFNNFDDNENRIGLIAQEVREHFPELVNTDPKTDYLTLDYTGLVPVLLGAIKELKNKVEDLESRL